MYGTIDLICINHFYQVHYIISFDFFAANIIYLVFELFKSLTCPLTYLRLYDYSKHYIRTLNDTNHNTFVQLMMSARVCPIVQAVCSSLSYSSGCLLESVL